MRRLAAVILAWTLSVSSGTAYYHFIHYRPSPLAPVPEKFDLTALPNKTVTFFASDTGPTQFPVNDSFPSVLSQIQQATQIWNSVESSDLRVAFGGLFSLSTPKTTPGGEVVFEELPPGLLGFGGPTSRSDIVSGPNGPFVPITRAVVHLNRDLTKRPGPSYTDSFISTVVHEMGHALGLQHTLTSSAMSTAVTRATSRTKPLESDDIAGLSLLYPGRNFAATTGSISGRVTSGGQGIHLASVVALRQGASAVSALTNPDGTYRIDGLRPGDPYFIYVHPLPPPSQPGLGPADLILPVDSSGNAVPDSGPIETLFYPGVKDPSQATPIQVTPGARVDGIDLDVQRRPAVQIYDVSTFGYIVDTIAVRPGYFNPSVGTGVLVARGAGIVANGSAAPGLNVQVVGGSARVAPNGIRPYAVTNLALDLTFTVGAGLGPRHLLFSLPNDIYVLPSGLNLVQASPPSIAAVTNNSDGTVSITGANLGPDSQVYFDGFPAPIVNSAGGRLLAQVPPGFSNQRATVTVVNADGQSSAFVQAPPVFSYDAADPPSATLNPSALPVGVEAMIEVTGLNTRFLDGRTIVGLGSSDLFVRRVWVLSPNRLLANVVVAPSATSGASLATVISGFQVIAQPFGFQVLPTNPRLPVLNSQLVNAQSAATGIFPGATVNLFGSNLASASGSTTLSLNDVRATILSASSTQVTFQMPPSVAAGPAVLRLNNGADNALPVVVSIDPAPPQILSINRSSNLPIDVSRPAQAGEFLTIVVSGLAEPGALVAPNRMRISVGGVEHFVIAVAPSAGQPAQHQIQFSLSPLVPAGQAPVTVSIDGRTSFPFSIPIRGS